MTVHLLVETRYRWCIFRLCRIYHTRLKRMRGILVQLRDDALRRISMDLCVPFEFTRGGLCAETGTAGHLANT
jgi:hypothetical protein